MLRIALVAAVMLAPSFVLADDATATRSLGGVTNSQSSASTSTAAQRPFIQTYDPTSAFDGYWFPSTGRASDGQEDR